MTFDIQRFFSDLNIPFKTSGKNIGLSSIGIECFGCKDPSEHLVVHKTGGYWKCWICGERGNIYALVKRLDDRNFKEIFSLYGEGEIKDLGKKEFLGPSPQSEIKKIEEIKNKNILNLLDKWLQSREFSSEDVLKWGCYLAELPGAYFAYRLVIPIIFEGKEVCYVARDMTGRSKKRYLASPSGTTKLKTKELFYNYDDLKNKKGVILVEGPTDVWRLTKLHCCRNYAVIAAFGKTLSKEQISLLNSKIKDMIEVVICLDSESYKECYEIVKNLCTLTDNLSYVRFLEEDLDPDEAAKQGKFELYFASRTRVT